MKSNEEKMALKSKLKEEKLQKKKEIKEEKIKIEALKKKRELIHKEMVLRQDINLKEEKIAPEGVCISLQHINKIYPNHVQAVYDFNLDIKEKEFIVFVGPSGCGKSTTLRMIAGLEDITAGDLYISGEFANTLLPKSRDCAMVFQTYALYPNMTVYDNMAFSLKVRHESKETINEKVLNAAKILELEEYLARKPSELSGGQRQRVALGRAIVRNAKVFLMDEPLSNLDAKLRVQMRSEIVNLHQKIGSTTIYVTHDQTEAMTMADRIVVMKDGYIQQIGTPKEIYNKPSNIFVATFIGAPSMNILEVELKKNKVILPNGIELKLSKEQIKEYTDSINTLIDNLKLENENLLKENEKLSNDEFINNDKLYKSHSFKKRIPDIINLNKTKVEENEKLIEKYNDELKTKTHSVLLGVRPEDICSINESAIIKNKSDSFPLYVRQAELLGNEYYIYSDISDKKIIAKMTANEEVAHGDTIDFSVNLNKIHLFDIDSKKRLF